MNLLENLRRQHRDLAEVFRDVESSLKKNVPFTDEDFRKDLSFMEGKLKIHLTMEDRHLYPLLLEEGNEAVRRAAEEYRREMMSLFDVFHAFTVRLKDLDPPEEGDEGMKEELLGIFERIGSRIAFEEETLWPLLGE